MTVPSNSQLFLPADYISRSERLTFNEDPHAYWNPKRIAGSLKFQHHVYELASQHARGVVADVGCGYPIKAAKFLAPFADKLFLVDQPSLKNVVHSVVSGAAFIATDLENGFTLPEPAQLIVCADVIEHLLNPLPLLASVVSELQEGGTLIISTPDREGLRGSRNRHSPKAEHVREWSKSEFRELIQQTGLRIIDHRSSPPGRITSIEERLLAWQLSLPLARYRGGQILVARRE